MSKPTFDDIRKLYNQLILPFHLIERDMPLKIRNHQNDNDAEHSWSLSFLAVALAPEVDPSLDVGLVSLFATIHDIVEVYAGDTSVWSEEDSLNSKTKREAEALKKLGEEFPQFPGLVKSIKDYESKTSNEALFVYALDKFINLLNLYESKGHLYHEQRITAKKHAQQLERVKHREKAHSHPDIAKYYDQLRDEFYSHPEYFYEIKSD